VSVVNPMLAAVWERGLPLTRERLTELDNAAAAGHALTAEQRASAAATAHKLSGSLGMFGFPEGTEAAREIEQMLEAEGPIDVARFIALTTRLRAALGL